MLIKGRMGPCFSVVYTANSDYSIPSCSRNQDTSDDCCAIVVNLHELQPQFSGLNQSGTQCGLLLV